MVSEHTFSSSRKHAPWREKKVLKKIVPGIEPKASSARLRGRKEKVATTGSAQNSTENAAHRMHACEIRKKKSAVLILGFKLTFGDTFEKDSEIQRRMKFDTPRTAPDLDFY